MLKAIAAAIARIFKIGVGGLRWAESVVLSPFRALFGGGGAIASPEYNPTMTSIELLDEYEANRKAQTALKRSDRDGIETIMKYAAASPAARATTDLSAVPADARGTLLTMDEHELKALAAAGPGRVRNWLEAKDHNIFGIPSVTPAQPVVTPASPPPTNMSHAEQMVWRMQAHLGKPDHSKEFRIA
ncbi:hypothetical protein [Rhizobium leguminosarum]|uniref:hypothetical protein n=1 Tax=Rhizobium leguminosarum TaxID=384 RepID=UPI001AE1497F|nr:hypothetical protein [Rhizobium leguminosarum]MBP2447007.1 hypothetical protein [Rhizobium leguminosarum]